MGRYVLRQLPPLYLRETGGSFGELCFGVPKQTQFVPHIQVIWQTRRLCNPFIPDSMEIKETHTQNSRCLE